MGVTISETEAALSRQHCRSVVVGNLDQNLDDVNGQFDAVLMSHILEHLADPKEVVAQAINLLNPGGLLVAAVPNMAHWQPLASAEKLDTFNEGPMDRTHLPVLESSDIFRNVHRTGA